MSTSEVHRGNGVETAAFGAFAVHMRALRIALGIGTVALGLAVVFWPDITLVVVAVFFGAHLIVMGAMRIASAVVSETAGWLRAVLFFVGILLLVAGLICLRNPFVSLLSLVILISIGWMVDGIAELVALASPDSERRWLHVFSGLVSIAGAVVILFWPGLALLTFTLLGGWLLVIFGAIGTFSALRERRAVTRSEPMRAGGSTAATA